MKPEDSARLAREAVMGNTRGIREDAVAELRRIIDEQAAEIARLETQSENQARIIDTQRRLAQCGESKFEAENEVLKEQLAEERAKLRCQEGRFMWRHAAEKERADRAERAMVTQWPVHDADDRTLPEDAAINEAFPTRSGRHDLYAEAMRLVGARRSKGGLVALVNWLLHRADETSHAAIIAWFDENKDAAVKQIGDLNGVLENELTEAQARVVELQALVDAATHFEFDRGYEAQTHAPPSEYPCWWVSKDGDGVRYMLPKEEAIALARDLAAKEKEPKW